MISNDVERMVGDHEQDEDDDASRAITLLAASKHLVYDVVQSRTEVGHPVPSRLTR